MKNSLPVSIRLFQIIVAFTTFLASTAYGQVVFEDLSLPLGGNAQSVETADVNGDGAPDIIATLTFIDVGEYGSEYSRYLLVFINNGLGSFLPVRAYRTETAPYEIDFADVDGDGDLDVAVANGGGDQDHKSINILYNNGLGQFFSRSVYPSNDDPTGRPLIKFVDWDNDGDPDLVSTIGQNETSFTWLSNNGAGFFSARESTGFELWPSYILAVTDFNLDGMDDLVKMSLGSIDILLSAGNGGILQSNPYRTRSSYLDLAVADFTDDDIPDLVLGQNSRMLFLRNDGLANLRFAGIYNLGSDESYNDAEAVDINNDGILDFALPINVSYAAQNVERKSGLSVLLGGNSNSDSLVEERIHFETEPEPDGITYPSSIASADFDGDGVVDIVMSDTATSKLLVFYNRTASTSLSVEVSGVNPRRITCKNFTTGQVRVIGGGLSVADCQNAGLTTQPGDSVSVVVAGWVTEPDLVGASTRGISDKRFVNCNVPGNRKRIMTMQEHWNCAEMGLSLSPGDPVTLAASGIVY